MQRIPAFSSAPNIVVEKPTPFSLPEFSPEVVDTSFAARFPVGIASGTKILLIPHHLVAGREIASLLSAVATPTRVILLSPDHFSRGTTSFSTTQRGFFVSGTTMLADTPLLKTLEAAVPSLTETDSVFEHEHGVRGLLPFFQHAWGNPLITPITLRVHAKKTELDELSNALATALKDETHPTLLVATIDFSHYQPANVADFHDVRSQRALESLDAEMSSSLEIDSPPTFSVLTQVAKKLDLERVTIHAHTNSLRLMHARLLNNSTSHFIASFSPGTTFVPQTTTTLLTDDRLVLSEENRFPQGVDQVRTLPRFPFDANIGLVETTTSVHAFIFPLQKEHGKMRTYANGLEYQAKTESLRPLVKTFLEKSRSRQHKPLTIE